MSFDAPRELTDPKAMRALAHPVRLALLEALSDAGPLTATEAGERVGESPANASFHLRQLAKYGFVEEAGGGAGRRRPWRRKQTGLRFSNAQADAATAAAARGLSRTLHDRFLARAQAGLAERDALSPAWQDATGLSQMTLYVTPEEMKAAFEALYAVMEPFRERIADPAKRPEGAEKIEVVTLAYPVAS
jgi:predicted ArsR family transcriptional regulator